MLHIMPLLACDRWQDELSRRVELAVLRCSPRGPWPARRWHTVDEVWTVGEDDVRTVLEPLTKDQTLTRASLDSLQQIGIVA